MLGLSLGILSSSGDLRLGSGLGRILFGSSWLLSLDFLLFGRVLLWLSIGHGSLVIVVIVSMDALFWHHLDRSVLLFLVFLLLSGSASVIDRLIDDC